MTSTSSFPYIHISCPCAEESPTPTQPLPKSPTKRDSSHGDDPFGSPLKPVSRQIYKNNPVRDDDEEEQEEDITFDPLNPRSAFSLFPIENLLYCEDCRQIRCPRCVQDEIVCWFCPSCLFEVPSSTIKSDGNRYQNLMNSYSWKHKSWLMFLSKSIGVHVIASIVLYAHLYFPSRRLGHRQLDQKPP